MACQKTIENCIASLSQELCAFTFNICSALKFVVGNEVYDQCFDVA